MRTWEWTSCDRPIGQVCQSYHAWIIMTTGCRANCCSWNVRHTSGQPGETHYNSQNVVTRWEKENRLLGRRCAHLPTDIRWGGIQQGTFLRHHRGFRALGVIKKVAGEASNCAVAGWWKEAITAMASNSALAYMLASPSSWMNHLHLLSPLVLSCVGFCEQRLFVMVRVNFW